MYENCTDGVLEYIGDGFCDRINNKKSCLYDGGDCCRCSCLDGLQNECGINGFDCLDEGCLDHPSIADQLPDCAGTLLKLGDGNCDGINNTPDCGYDGGDCCICTCVDSMACTFGFNCIDPDAGDELYACDEIPSEIIPACSDHGDQNWIVENAAQARTLAKTTKCSGGSFQVDWRGNVSMYETIYAVDGTVLHIYGTHAGAVMSGNLQKRLITVVNASLYLTNVRVEFGLAVVGGAIAASRSNLTLNQTFFVSNQARGMGGALYVMDESIVSFDGETTIFSNNVADTSGGAIYVAGGSVVSWKGQNTSFIDNLSDLDGGAATIRDGSVASWSGAVSFSNNTCGGNGGAVYALGHTKVAWDGPTYFFNNTAGYYGGGISSIDGSNVSWSAEMTLDHNFAGAYGGGVLLHGSTLSWNGKTRFYDNRAGVYGGAMFVYNHSDVFGSGDTTYVGNIALAGGAMLVSDSCTVSWSGETIFSSNTAQNLSGGAVVVQDSSQALWSGKTTFANNSAKQYGGGILVVDNCTVSWSGETILASNTAQDYDGGAVFVHGNSQALWSGKTTFANNSAKRFGGGIAVVYNCTVSWSGETIFASNTAQSSDGGGIYVTISSQVLWSGNMTFTNNSAVDHAGGAIALSIDSTASWNSETTFTKNTATSGGAVYIAVNCTVNFNGKTTFDANAASMLQGGALSSEYSNIYFRDKATFVGNTALSFGGAVAVMAKISVSDSGSQLVLAGPTVFENNTCEENGGGLGLIGGVLVQLQTTEILFSGNRATIAGGAIFMWGNDLGPYFIGMKFFSNFASHGGGVFSVGSGNALYGLDSEQRSNPLVFIRCSFVDNQAIATGGAIHSAAGQDLLINTTFSGNTASEGGALSLAGTTGLVNCSFVEKISDEG